MIPMHEVAVKDQYDGEGKICYQLLGAQKINLIEI